MFEVCVLFEKHRLDKLREWTTYRSRRISQTMRRNEVEIEFEPWKKHIKVPYYRLENSFISFLSLSFWE